MKSGGKPKNLKQNNTRAVLDAFRRGGLRSVAGMSADINLSKTTVKKLFDGLLALDLIQSAGKGDSTDEGGKKPELYRFNKDHGYVIALHVTPDTIITVCTDLCADITWIKKEAIGQDRGIDAILGRLAQAVRDCGAFQTGLPTAQTVSRRILAGIAVVLPGLVDPARGTSIYSPHFPGWGRDLPFSRMLIARLDPDFRVPLHIDNANRFQAVAEARKGLAGGCRNFCIVDALSEGLGAGVVLQGELLQGMRSLAGEFGHMTLDPYEGFPCICGHRGCFEAMVSARRVLGLARAMADRFPASTLFRDKDPNAVGLADICDGAAAGDPLCESLMDDVARWFLVGLGNVIMVNDPELIVLQGVYVRAGPRFLTRIREGIRHIGLPDVEKPVRIEYSKMGEERGVIGGAAFVIEDYFARQVF